jgi:hypothetical protein
MTAASLTAKFIGVVVTALVVGTAVSLVVALLLMAARQAALVATLGSSKPRPVPR